MYKEGSGGPEKDYQGPLVPVVLSFRKAPEGGGGRACGNISPTNPAIFKLAGPALRARATGHCALSAGSRHCRALKFISIILRSILAILHINIV